MTERRVYLFLEPETRDWPGMTAAQRDDVIRRKKKAGMYFPREDLVPRFGLAVATQIDPQIQEGVQYIARRDSRYNRSRA